MLTRSPALPENVSAAFCPGVVVVTVTGGPSAEIVAAASAGTS